MKKYIIIPEIRAGVVFKCDKEFTVYAESDVHAFLDVRRQLERLMSAVAYANISAMLYLRILVSVQVPAK